MSELNHRSLGGSVINVYRCQSDPTGNGLGTGWGTSGGRTGATGRTCAFGVVIGPVGDSYALTCEPVATGVPQRSKGVLAYLGVTS